MLMRKVIVISFIILNIYANSFAMLRTSSKRLLSTVKTIARENELASIALKQDLLSNLSQSTNLRKQIAIAKSNKKVQKLEVMKLNDNIDINAALIAEKRTISQKISQMNAALKRYVKKHDKLEQLEEDLYR